MSDVRETIWAKCDKERVGILAAALDAAHETALVQWQERVDAKPGDRVLDPSLNHVSTYVVTATHNTTDFACICGGIFDHKHTHTKPTVPARTKTFIVVSSSSEEAMQRVWREIGKEWSLGLNAGPMFIDGQRRTDHADAIGQARHDVNNALATLMMTLEESAGLPRSQAPSGGTPWTLSPDDTRACLERIRDAMVNLKKATE